MLLSCRRRWTKGTGPLATVEEAQEVLEALGMPSAQTNRMSGLTLLALCGLEPDDPWSAASRTGCTVTKSIMSHVTEHYGIEYAPNTRETFRRQVLHQFIQGGIADYNPFEPDLPTNSPRAHYAITKAALTAVREYGGEGWPSARTIFLREQGSLAERYARDRESGDDSGYGWGRERTTTLSGEAQRVTEGESSSGLHHASRPVPSYCIWATRQRRICSSMAWPCNGSASRSMITTNCRTSCSTMRSEIGCSWWRP